MIFLICGQHGPTCGHVRDFSCKKIFSGGWTLKVNCQTHKVVLLWFNWTYVLGRMFQKTEWFRASLHWKQLWFLCSWISEELWKFFSSNFRLLCSISKAESNKWVSGSRQIHNSPAVGRKRDADRTGWETRCYSSAGLLLVLFLLPGEGDKPCAHLQQQVLPPSISITLSSASLKAAASLILQCSGTGRAIRRSWPHDCSRAICYLRQLSIFAYTYRQFGIQVLLRNGLYIQRCSTGGH